MDIDDITTCIKTASKSTNLKSMRCATFRSLNHACKYIAIKSGISVKEAYSILISIGYNSIEHGGYYKEGNLLKELSDLVYRYILSLNPKLLDIVPFDTQHTKNELVWCAIDESMSKKIDNRAEDCAIKVYTLNKYYAMLGLRELIKNDPEYKMLKESDIGKCVLSQLNQFENGIREWTFDVKHDVDNLNAPARKEPSSYNEKFIQMNADMSSIGLEFIEYEHQMNIGRVDILYNSGNEFVIVEVKKGTANTNAIGQVLKYVCTFNKPCRGMIIAERFTKSVIKSANDLHIDLVKYATWLNDDMERCVKIRRL